MLANKAEYRTCFETTSRFGANTDTDFSKPPQLWYLNTATVAKMDTTMNSASDSDDWGTPRKPRNSVAFDNNDVVQFVDSDQEILLGGGDSVLHRGPKGSKKKAAKKPAKKAVRFSHSAAAFETGDDESLSDPAPTTANTKSPRIRTDSPGLFVSEDEEGPFVIRNPLIVKGSTELTYADNTLRKHPINTMDGLKRARAIKESINKNISVLQPPDKITSVRPNFEDDPENKIIKDLRNEQDMGWGDLANFLNQERRSRGEAANFTAEAVYTRYVRSAPKIAVPINELGFDPKDYMHLRHPNQYTNVEGTGMISKAGKKRVKNYDNAKELEANMRKPVKEDEYGDLETDEKTEQLMDAVAKVERNFWTFVADEMERSTTKLYPAGRLASRYHAV
ncbi:hypothetical protein CC86DRAFT_460840 [Ophiobolus disseminans]|uniref:Uncharacterized protein n=1 Tax=Ophiobolus disseminans TaxID=1469910 RepID=A0A6A6ZE00_9PLEO|nr:hypothetical protein CC86DRAFT_460840 [Ophiobolus disseminans]